MSNPCRLTRVCRDRRGGVHGVQGVARTHVLYPEPSVVGRDPCPPRAALSRPCWSDARANDHLHDHEDARDPPRHQAAASEWTGTNTKSGNRGRVQTFRGPTSELSPDTRVCTHRESPTFPPSLPTPAFYPPSHSSRPTPSDPDRLKWFVFDLTTTAAAVHGGTLFPPRTLPSFSVSRRMCGGVAPLPARYVCIYIFVCRSSWHARSVYDAITSKIFRRVFGRLWLFGGWNGRTEETGGDATVRGSGVAVLPPPPPLLTRRTDIVYPTI